MARKEEHLTPGQKILAIRFVSVCGEQQIDTTWYNIISLHVNKPVCL